MNIEIEKREKKRILNKVKCPLKENVWDYCFYLIRLGAFFHELVART